MSDQPGTLHDSKRFLREVLVRFWLVGSLVIAGSMIALNLRDRQHDVILESEYVVHAIRASMQANIPLRRRQVLLDSYVASLQEDRLDGLNVVLLLDQRGVVIYSSRSHWQQLRIEDPLISLSEADDPDFQRVVSCFRNRQLDCYRLRSLDSWLHPSSFSVVRPLQLQPTRLGLPRQNYLVIVNFDPGVLAVSLAGDVLVTLPSAALLSGLLTLGLGSILYGRLLPQLTAVAQTDGLTCLMNRTLFTELAKDLLAEAEEQQRPIVFAILDLDYFKRINDTYGHDCGDAALAQVAELLATVTRPEDLLCRFGGEEFALLLGLNREAGTKALERLRLQLQMTRLHHAGHQIPLQASFGAAASSECGYNLDYLYTCADKALYAAKESGRNRVEWNDGQPQSWLVR